MVGHYLWYLGWFVVVAALARAVHEHPMPTSARARAGCLLLAVGVGVTAGTNALEGGTIPLTAAATLAGIGHGLRRRGRLPELLAWAGGCALLVIAAWGLWTGGFAQPSALRPFSPR